MTSTVALGAVSGAMLTVRRPITRLRSLAVTAATLSMLELTAGLARGPVFFSVLLMGIGMGTVALLTSANSVVQFDTDPSMRGRVMGVYLLVITGTGALGGPIVGYVDQHLGAQSGLVLAGIVGLVATTAVALHLARLGHLGLVLYPVREHGWTLTVVRR
jgi:MFS family permease